MRFFIWTLLIFSFKAAVFGQQRLKLGKLHSNNIIYYEVGEYLRFQLVGSKEFMGGKIWGFKNDTIVFRYADIPLKSIASIDIQHKPRKFQRLYGYGKTVQMAGVMYGVLTLLQGFGPRALLPTVFLELAGTLMRKAPGKYYRIGPKKRLSIVEYA